ncbi:MAG: hypothetical protein UV74_C0001G0006 [Candidatus Woesebacteria bacterium GW2011_GWB1_43_14]|uniref:Uncharacterized protein n=1 Tax=Candidatus Woesebacteria bacterium GW2011_GWB1_43_14 TaxID=1618578 RepID=A0A0G1FV72_9BACT|nr:MAG: hypothetical protein UV51_C0011G0005 [Candidatus Woesebacteria bacterium GW2011_GWC1_42_9]KKS98896.1 MAG: hypothetical protein UV74_C0001G0006 [Candidatus Woesebacteria bacterium GW2011_GWB1_43_14]
MSEQGPPEYDGLAEWDDGKYDVHVREDGHTTVSGRIDGDYYHRSWDADGSKDHSRLDDQEGQDGHHWTVDHD